MQHKAGVSGQPTPHVFVSVGAVIVQNQVQRFILRKLPVKPPQKLQKLLMTMTRIALPDDPSFDHLQRGKQSGYLPLRL